LPVKIRGSLDHETLALQSGETGRM
jgi:hypothetical protein